MGERLHLRRDEAGYVYVYVAVVVDVYARYIVGWCVSGAMRASFLVDALEQVLHATKPQRDSEVIKHSHRELKYASIR